MSQLDNLTFRPLYAESPGAKKISLGEKAKAFARLAAVESKRPVSILASKAKEPAAGKDAAKSKDPLASLALGGGSKRNALLKWCQTQTCGYRQVDISNFSSSWNDGVALCALLDRLAPHLVRFSSLDLSDARACFRVAFDAAEALGVPCSLDINEVTTERPDWQAVYAYVSRLYAHFEAQ